MNWGLFCSVWDIFGEYFFKYFFSPALSPLLLALTTWLLDAFYIPIGPCGWVLFFSVYFLSAVQTVSFVSFYLQIQGFFPVPFILLLNQSIDVLKFRLLYFSILNVHLVLYVFVSLMRRPISVLTFHILICFKPVLNCLFKHLLWLLKNLSDNSNISGNSVLASIDCLLFIQDIPYLVFLLLWFCYSILDILVIMGL